MGAATQVKVPRVTKVTRETQIDPKAMTVVDTGEQAAGVDYVRELLRTPLVEGSMGPADESSEEEDEAPPPPKISKKGRQAGLPMLPPISFSQSLGKVPSRQSISSPRRPQSKPSWPALVLERASSGTASVRR